MKLSANLSCENEYYLYENKRVIFVLMVLHLALPRKRGWRNSEMTYNLVIYTFKESRFFPLLSGAMEGSQKERLRLNDSNSMLMTLSM